MSDLAPAAWQRATVWSALALLALLNILAASPHAHAWFHGREALYDIAALVANAGGVDDESSGMGRDELYDEDGCVITKFGQGHFAFKLLLVVLVQLAEASKPVYPPVHDAVDLPAVDYELPFSRGPPRV